MNLTKLKTGAQTLFLEGWTSYVTIAISMLLLMAVVGIVATYVIRFRAEEMTQAHSIKEQKSKV